MTIADVKSGGWAIGELLTSDQLDLIRGELLKCIDGVGGGSYTLGATLTIAGADVRFDDILRIRTGGTLTVDAGGTLDIDGDATLGGDFGVLSGADINLLSGGGLNGAGGSLLHMQSASETRFSSGADVNFEAGVDVLIDDLDDLVVDGDSHTYMVCLSSAYWEFDEANGEDFWSLTIGAAPGNWVMGRVAASGAQLFFPLRVDPGDVITNIIVTVDGAVGSGHAGLPSALPDITLVEGGVGLAVDIASETDTSGSLGAYEAVHTITLDNTTTGGIFPYTALTDKFYLLRINGERGTDSEGDELAIMRIRMTVVRNKLVPTGII